ncbi:hypothetical protein AALO_G00237770 [Alosa alosa]|uniref:Large ribosomal subunit protein uL14m n=2 Tax=Alosa alosa TaxID=278164 RepID=A0AAV6FWT0_9TELE|nr:hypothetical protein AALO_G00237770 [Alosa alosa]
MQALSHTYDVNLTLSKHEVLRRGAMALLRSIGVVLCDLASGAQHKAFSVSAAVSAIQKMSRVRVVDNSALGTTPYHRPPRVIHVYTKNGVGKVGDRILLAIKGQKKKALIVGHKMPGLRMTPRFDSNNVVLIEDNGNPTGTRIKVPIPTHLREKEGEYSKLLAIAQRFV